MCTTLRPDEVILLHDALSEYVDTGYLARSEVETLLDTLEEAMKNGDSFEVSLIVTPKEETPVGVGEIGWTRGDF